MYNESEVVYVKKEIKTEFLDENEIKSEVETPADEFVINNEYNEQDANEVRPRKQTNQETSITVCSSKVNVSVQPQLSLHPDESASLNGKRRSTSITNSAGGTNEEDILIKEEIKSENSTSSSVVVSKSKEISVNKPAVEKLFKSTRGETKSSSTDKSLNHLSERVRELSNVMKPLAPSHPWARGVDCAILSCKFADRKQVLGLSCHRIPTRNLKIRQKWLELIRDARDDANWEPRIDARVCSRHFETASFSFNNRKVLHSWSVPSLLLHRESVTNISDTTDKIGTEGSNVDSIQTETHEARLTDNESEVVYVKKEIKTEFLDENEIKSDVIEEEETPADDFVPNNEYNEQDVNAGRKQTHQLTYPTVCNRSKINVSDQPQLSLHPEDSVFASLNGKKRSVTISVGGTNEEDILIKEEIKSENRNEFEFKLEFAEEETVLDDLVPCESIVQKIDQQNFSSPCNRSNTDFSPQQVSHLAWIVPNDNLGNSETRPAYDEDDGNSKRGQSLCEESLMDETSDHLSFMQNALNREEEKLEISSAILTSSSVASKSKEISVSKPAVKKLFKSTRGETESSSTDKSLKTKRFSCEKCESSFSTKSHLIFHTKTVHDRITRYECYFCCKRFFRLATLFDHIRRHTKEQPFICCICGSKYMHRVSLSAHIKALHEGIQPLKSLKCTFEKCDKRFASKSHLNDHLRIHTGERPFKCDMCDSKFRRITHLNRHIKAVHLVIKPFKCNFKDCDKRFAMKGSLIEHMRIHKKQKERPFKCDICESKFKQRKDLNRHIKVVHQRIKPFKCTYDGCAYQGSKKCDLNVHIRIHTGETPFQCLICKKRFRIKCTLTRHENKKIKCQPAAQNTVNCDENLEISSALACTSASVPSKSNKLKPFKCSYKGCNKQYTQEFYLTDHMRIHTISEAISNMIYM